MIGFRAPLASAVLLTAGLVAGCSGETTGLNEDTYVEVMARLSLSRTRSLGTPTDDSTRAAVLEEFGLTGRDLEDFAERYGDDLTRMARLWDLIRVRVDSLDHTVDTSQHGGLLRVDTLGRELRTP